jgi:hypothetical protein
MEYHGDIMVLNPCLGIIYIQTCLLKHGFYIYTNIYFNHVWDLYKNILYLTWLKYVKFTVGMSLDYDDKIIIRPMGDFYPWPRPAFFGHGTFS